MLFIQARCSSQPVKKYGFFRSFSIFDVCLTDCLLLIPGLRNWLIFEQRMFSNNICLYTGSVIISQSNFALFFLSFTVQSLSSIRAIVVIRSSPYLSGMQISMDIPCPSCGDTFQSIWATYAHFSWCKKYARWSQTQIKMDLKVLLHTPKWRKYFHPDQTLKLKTISPSHIKKQDKTKRGFTGLTTKGLSKKKK